MVFYAVARGKNPGVYLTWEECSKEVSGFPGAVYKKFPRENDALEYIRKNMDPPNKQSVTTNLLPAVDSRTNSLMSSVVEGGISCLKRKSSADWIESNDKKRRLMEKLQSVQDKLESALLVFRNLVNEVKSIKEELSDGSQTPKKAILIDIEDAPHSLTSSSFSHLPGSSVQRLEGIRSSGENTSMPFKVDDEGYVEVYTDGACSNNGYGGAKAGIGVWFGDGHCLNVSEPVKGRATNNSAEIEAVTLAILHAKEAGVSKLKVHTDSSFLINAITKWIRNWKRNNWKTAAGEPVKNKEELVLLDKAKQGIDVKFVHVSGHVGIHGNEAADALARAGARRYVSTS